MSTGAARKIKADLHIHTCLSPCGDWDMTPLKIMAKVSAEQIDLIAVCDHNSAKNTPPLIKLGRQYGITVLAGMEICTKEEVHLLGLFDSVSAARRMEKLVYAFLKGKNAPDIFGHQVIADENDMVLGCEEKRLIGASDISLDRAVKQIRSLGGIVIAAHIDRPSYSIISQLGFIPPDTHLDAVEVSPGSLDKTVDNFNIPCVCSSDAHFLNDIGAGYTLFNIEKISFDSIKSALSQRRIEALKRKG